MKKASKSSSKPLTKLSVTYSIFLAALPPLLFFSYFPVISLGGNETMNFELSLPLLWLIFFDLFALFLLIKTRHCLKSPKIAKSSKSPKSLNSPNPLKFSKILLWLPFPIFLTLSIAWSLNPLRGLLTAGILWLIYFAVFSFFALHRSLPLPKNFPKIFWGIFFGSSLLVAAWCWLQSILDLSGLPQATTLMCDGCTSGMFGFPHPNGFAIEPQFMGNLLLAPTLLAAYFLFSPNPNSKIIIFKKFHRRTESSITYDINFSLNLFGILCYLAFLFLVATLFFTLSRGAIYAFLVGLLLLTILKILREQSPRFLLSWLFVIVAFLCTLNIQGIMSENGPTSDTYESGVAKIIHQLSLGLIDLRNPAIIVTDDTILDTISVPEQGTELPGTSESISSSEASSLETSEPSKPTSVFDGYIASSTIARVNLNISAISIWQSTPKNLLIGVGLGGAGQALYDADQSPAPKEIVQNQYASLLLETGLVGVALALLTLFLILKAVAKSPLSAPLFALLAAYAVTLLFFSGLPNALQIYLLPPLLLLVAEKPKIPNLPRRP